MRTQAKKYIVKVLKESVLNFVGKHPRLITVLAGLGTTIAFSSVWRLVVHEVNNGSIVKILNYGSKYH
jgi:hypothetical protein